MSIHYNVDAAECCLLPGNVFPSLEVEGIDCIVCRRHPEPEEIFYVQWRIVEFPKLFLVADYTESNLRAGLSGGEPVVGVTSRLTVDPSVSIGLADPYTVNSKLLDTLSDAAIIHKLTKKNGLYRIVNGDLPSLSQVFRYIETLAWDLGHGEYLSPPLDQWLFGENGVMVAPSAFQSLKTEAPSLAPKIDDIPF